MPKILIWEFLHADLHQGLLDMSYVVLDLHENPNQIIDYEQVHGVVVRSKVIDQKTIDLFPNLRFIARAGSGIENINVNYAKQKNIAVLNSPEANRIAVAEHALGMLLALVNNIVHSNQEVRQGIWNRSENWGSSLYGKTIGIIGYGHTGSAFAQVLQGLHVKILAYDKYIENYGNLWVEESTLEHILVQSDVISLHLPQTHETIGFCNQDFFNSLRKKIILINTSRGKITHSGALLDAINQGKLAGACLDVLDTEALDFENASTQNKIINELIAHPKVLITPHIAGWTHESFALHSQVLLEKIQKLLKKG